MENKLKILLLAYSCRPNSGSDNGVGWNWTLMLAQKYEVYVVTDIVNKTYIEDFNFNESETENIHFYYYGLKHNIYNLNLNFIPQNYIFKYIIWQKDVYNLCEKIVYENKIDIFHKLTLCEYRFPGKFYNINIPLVWGPIGGGHEYNPIFNRAYFNKSDIAFEKIRMHINHLSLHSPNFLNTIKKAKAIIVSDQSTLKILPVFKKYYRLNEIIPDISCNIKDYNKCKHNATLHLLIVGTLYYRKGTKIIIDSLGRSNFRNFKLTIIGEGKDSEKLKKLAKSYGIENNIKFTGRLNYKLTQEYYYWADLLLFPSIRDTTGTVIFEAMAHGVPVIALNQNGAADIINEDIGDLIDVTNYDDILQKYLDVIMRYYNDRDLIEIKGTKARNKIETEYSKEAILLKISNIYNSVIE